MNHVNVALRAYLFTLLSNLRRIVLPLETAQEALTIRIRSAVYIGKRVQRLNKVLAKSQKALDDVYNVMNNARDGIEFRHARKAFHQSCDAIDSLKWAIEAAENEWLHALTMIDEARARLAEVDTPTMRKRLAEIDSVEKTLKMMD